MCNNTKKKHLMVMSHYIQREDTQLLIVNVPCLPGLKMKDFCTQIVQEVSVMILLTIVDQYLKQNSKQVIKKYFLLLQKIAYLFFLQSLW